MVGIGTLVNTSAIIGGGVLGLFIGKLLTQKHQAALIVACGISVIFIGIAGAMEGMLAIAGEHLVSTLAMMVSISLTLGTLFGEILNLHGIIERFASWLKTATKNEHDNQFINAFLTASLTVSVGAMAIVGALEDGMNGDWSILATKSILDFVIVMIMTSSLGKGAIFSALPVFIIEGSITAFAILVQPFMTDVALSYISLIGSILIFCVGINLLWEDKIRVVTMLPAIVIAYIFTLLPL